VVAPKENAGLLFVCPKENPPGEEVAAGEVFPNKPPPVEGVDDPNNDGPVVDGVDPNKLVELVLVGVVDPKVDEVFPKIEEVLLVVEPPPNNEELFVVLPPPNALVPKESVFEVELGVPNKDPELLVGVLPNNEEPVELLPVFVVPNKVEPPPIVVVPPPKILLVAGEFEDPKVEFDPKVEPNPPVFVAGWALGFNFPSLINCISSRRSSSNDLVL